jgi:hypothetical protein
MQLTLERAICHATRTCQLEIRSAADRINTTALASAYASEISRLATHTRRRKCCCGADQDDKENFHTRQDDETTKLGGLWCNDDGRRDNSIETQSFSV